MIYENLSRGRAKIASYVPTVTALRYLKCCTIAGWHNCNELYHQHYPQGVSAALILYTLGGMGKIQLKGNTYTLIKDTLILVPSNTPMEYFTDSQTGSWEFYWVDLTGDDSLSVIEKLWEDEQFYFKGIKFVDNLFSELLKESSSEIGRSTLVGKIFDRIISDVILGDSQRNLPIDQILEYISQNYQRHIDLSQLSELFYLSKNQIIRVVRKRTGYTPHEYLIRLRLTKACELLQYSQMSIMDVGRAVGYENNSHFSAAFRRIYGIAPFEYRCKFSD